MIKIKFAVFGEYILLQGMVIIGFMVITQQFISFILCIDLFVFHPIQISVFVLL